MRLRSSLIVGLIIVLSLGAVAYPIFARPKIQEHEHAIQYYQSILLNEQAYLTKTQLANGALAMRPRSDGEAYVNPYFANFTAHALMLGEQVQSEVVRDYLAWFFLNINKSDPKHRAGSIDDFTYTIVSGEIMDASKLEYDSVDSYLASFIIALHTYLIESQDTGLLIEYEHEWLMILEAFDSTRNPENDLAMVSLANRTQYLMDNTEVYGALILIQDIFDLYWLVPERNKSLENQFQLLENKMSYWNDTLDNQINTHLFDEKQFIYAYGLDADGKLLTSKVGDRFYPDGVGQLYPILFGVDTPKSENAEYRYALFNQNYKWTNFDQFKQGVTDFYWFVVVYAAALMKDETQLLQFLLNYEEEIMPVHPYPIYNAEVAWVIMACDEMISHHINAIQTLDPFKLLRSKP